MTAPAAVSTARAASPAGVKLNLLPLYMSSSDRHSSSSVLSAVTPPSPPPLAPLAAGPRGAKCSAQPPSGGGASTRDEGSGLSPAIFASSAAPSVSSRSRPTGCGSSAWPLPRFPFFCFVLCWRWKGEHVGHLYAARAGVLVRPLRERCGRDFLRASK